MFEHLGRSNGSETASKRGSRDPPNFLVAGNAIPITVALFNQGILLWRKVLIRRFYAEKTTHHTDYQGGALEVLKSFEDIPSVGLKHYNLGEANLRFGELDPAYRLHKDLVLERNHRSWVTHFR